MKKLRYLLILLTMLSTTTFLIAQDDPGAASDESATTDDATPNPSEPEADDTSTADADDDDDADATTTGDDAVDDEDDDVAPAAAPAAAPATAGAADLDTKWYKNPNKPTEDYLVFMKGPNKTNKNVYFAFGRHLYSINDKPKLHYIIKKLEAMPKHGVLVSGHTDHIGTYKENIGLSYKRAAAIRNGLVLHGLDASRIKIVGHSFKYQVYKNTGSNSKRALNRRVTFKILPLSQLFPKPQDYFVK